MCCLWLDTCINDILLLETSCNKNVVYMNYFIYLHCVIFTVLERLEDVQCRVLYADLHTSKVIAFSDHKGMNIIVHVAVVYC